MSNEEKKIPYGLTEAQASAIRCAHADMAGVYQCAIRDGNGGADNGHDWKAHRTSIEELEKEFPDLLEHIPLEDGVHWVNRMSYHVTNKPWTNESVDVAWDVRDEDDNEEN